MDLIKKEKYEDKIRDIVTNVLVREGFYDIEGRIKGLIEETIRQMLEDGKINMRPYTHIISNEANGSINYAETFLDMEIRDRYGCHTRRLFNNYNN